MERCQQQAWNIGCIDIVVVVSFAAQAVLVGFRGMTSVGFAESTT